MQYGYFFPKQRYLDLKTKTTAKGKCALKKNIVRVWRLSEAFSFHPAGFVHFQAGNFRH